ncbi:CCAAT/enhancer-binding protein zeta [Acropora cervicornis]|uniref:CCAAT/enhancer-binding protein zeta n=1 Tax=Acropora cervicornis TaxID=6130 RepID=A0AAD9QGR8_ACRCE|nr:CCAAT/enhancer-binding protein zeta [Acropora cervicornis]
MADKQPEKLKMKRKRSKVNSKVMNDLSLEDVVRAGGDEEDFKMLKDADTPDKSSTSDNGDLETSEVKSFIEQLGLQNMVFGDDDEGGDEEDTGMEGGTSPLPVNRVGKKNNNLKKERRGQRDKKHKFEDIRNEVPQDQLQRKKHNLPKKEVGAQQKLLIIPGGLWYDLIADEETTNNSYCSLDQSEIDQLFEEAASLVKNEVKIYDKMKGTESSSDYRWLKSVASSGTLKDKVAAMTIQVQESAIHGLRALDMLMGMAKKKGRRERTMTIGNRKLRKFDQHPLSTLHDFVHKSGNRDERDKRLILWYFEDHLKKTYKEFIGIIERETRAGAITKHPRMKLVVTKEVEKLLYRPNVAIKAQYYAICFLNQLILRKKDDEQCNKHALMLLFQVMDSRQSVSDRFYQALYAKLLDPTLTVSSKQVMFINVLYKSLKVDPSQNRVKAFVKRILQICSFQQPAFICGILFLISEEEDDEEHFVDAPSDAEDTSDKNNNTSKTDQLIGSHTNTIETRRKETDYSYKPHLRNPLYVGAEHSCAWEISQLCRHYHPFLDRFVYKNPKKKDADDTGSFMQQKRSSRLSEKPVNTAEFLEMKEEDIREDEVYFHRFFKRKAEQQKQQMKTSSKFDDEDYFANIEEEFEMDLNFASQLKESIRIKKKHDESDEEDDEDDDDGEESYDEDEEDNEQVSSKDADDYQDMMVSLSEEDETGEPTGQQDKKKKLTDHEKVPFENLGSDEFSEEDNAPSMKKKSKKGKYRTGGSSVFASADEFAHLLENSDASLGGQFDVMRGGVSDKQLQWEEKRERENWKGTRGRGKGKQKSQQRKFGHFSTRGRGNSKGRGQKRRR